MAEHTIKLFDTKSIESKDKGKLLLFVTDKTAWVDSISFFAASKQKEMIKSNNCLVKIYHISIIVDELSLMPNLHSQLLKQVHLHADSAHRYSVEILMYLQENQGIYVSLSNIDVNLTYNATICYQKR